MNRFVPDVDKCLTDSKSKTNSELQRSLRGLNFGRLYLKNGDLDTALKYVKSYLTVKPNSSDGHKLLAQIYESLGDDDSALLNYRKALDLKKGTNDSFVSINNSPNVTSMSTNSQTPDMNSISPNARESTPVRREKTPVKMEEKSEPCTICTNNQTILKKVVKQNEALMETNKVILDVLRQNNANISDVQQQIVSLNESMSGLTESHNALKDTLYDFMAQEENQDFDEYLLDDKENVSLDPNELLGSNQSNQWQSPVPQLSNLDSTKPLSELFKPAADSWQCKDCYVQNKSQDTFCAACSATKPGTVSVAPSAPQPANSTFSFQLPNATQPISFNPQLNSSTTSFKFGLNSNSNLNTESSSIFSNTTFKFGNTSSPQAFGSFTSPFGQLGSQSNQTIESKTNQNTNIFANNPNDSKSLNSFHFGSEPFSFQFSKQQPEPLNSPKITEIASESFGTPAKENQLNNSFSEVEPSNADNIYFQPVVPLPPKIEVKTGEEDEIMLYLCRARLFRFNDNEWKERGVGDLKILKSRDTDRIRLLMRRDTIFKVCLNQYITKDMKLELKDDKKSITWSAIDYSEDSPTPEIFLLRLKNAENAQLFLEAFNNAKASLEPLDNVKATLEPLDNVKAILEPLDNVKATLEPLDNVKATLEPLDNVKATLEPLDNVKATLEPLDNVKATLEPVKDYQSSSPLKASDTPNQPEIRQSLNDTSGVVKSKQDDDIEIIYEKVPQSQDHLDKVKNLGLPLNFFDYENKNPCPGCRGCPENEDKFFFTTPETKVSEEPKSEISNQPEESLFQSAIVATNVSKSDWKNTSGSKLWLSNSPAPLFSSDKNPDDDTVPENADIYFKPLIPLPDLVEVKTGEEDETVIYCQRAKLYRYEPQTKEWKERGVGDFKILKHNFKNRYRMVLRRDQILKIACNHYITSDITLNPMNTSETAVCWYAIDYTDGTPIEEQFAIKFKNKEILTNFKEVFNDCKSKLSDEKEDNCGQEN